MFMEHSDRFAEKWMVFPPKGENGSSENKKAGLKIGARVILLVGFDLFRTEASLTSPRKRLRNYFYVFTTEITRQRRQIF